MWEEIFEEESNSFPQNGQGMLVLLLQVFLPRHRPAFASFEEVLERINPGRRLEGSFCERRGYAPSAHFLF